MSEPVYASGTSKDIYQSVLTVERRLGGLEAHIVNTGEANGLTATVEAAPSTRRDPSVPQWDQAVAVYGPANIAGDAMGVCDVTAAAAEASHLHHYRVRVHSQATGAPTTYSVIAQDEKE